MESVAVNPPTYLRQWQNVKVLYSAVLGQRSGGMMKMLKGLGLKLQGRHHSGLDDCRNTARIVHELLQRGGVDHIRVTKRAKSRAYPHPAPDQHKSR